MSIEGDKLTKEEFDKFWPAPLDASLLAGAMEVGRELYITGSFGGFGGSLGVCFYDYEQAKNWVKDMKNGSMIYRIPMPVAVKYVKHGGEEIDP